MDKTIHNFKLFNELTDDEFSTLTGYFQINEYQHDDTVLDGASPERALFIVVSGAITGKPNSPGFMNKKQTTYLPGDFFGEVSLCTGISADGNCVAEEKSRVISLREEKVAQLISENSAIAVKFISQLLSLNIQHLRGSSKFFADIVEWGEQASRRVITDELTGVYNRLFLDDVLESFFNISKSNNKPLALFMIDLDNFRKINETLGIETGNSILQVTVSLIKKSISKHGIIARYGGDEFCILLPETGIEKAVTIAEQIRGEVEQYDFSKHLAGKDIPVTTSIGVSAYPDTVTEIAEFKGKADASLYEAKKLGRNRVEYLQ
ncbi:MAG TPA: GGDEF domain-containing protein [Spirochaetota bacterium]